MVEKNLSEQNVGEEFERKVFKELRLRSALFDQVELTNANFMNSIPIWLSRSSQMPIW